MSRLPAKTMARRWIDDHLIQPATRNHERFATAHRDSGNVGSRVPAWPTLDASATVPFGLLAPLAPRLVHRFGSGVVLLGCLYASRRCVVRSLPTLAGLFLGTLLIGIGVAIANVLMPGILKQDFPGHVGIMVGLYTMMLSAGAAFAAGTTVPLYRLLGRNWHLAVGFWALPVALAIVLWLPSRALGCRAPSVVRASSRRTLAQFGGLVAHNLHGPAVPRVLRNRAWLPTIFRDRGTPSETAGFLLALVSIVGMLGAFVAPWIAQKMTDQRLAVAIGTGAMALGIAGLLVDPHHLNVLWAMLLGWGQGPSIGLALMMMVVRASSRDEAWRFQAWLKDAAA